MNGFNLEIQRIGPTFKLSDYKLGKLYRQGQECEGSIYFVRRRATRYFPAEEREAATDQRLRTYMYVVVIAADQHTAFPLLIEAC